MIWEEKEPTISTLVREGVIPRTPAIQALQALLSHRDVRHCAAVYRSTTYEERLLHQPPLDLDWTVSRGTSQTVDWISPISGTECDFIGGVLAAFHHLLHLDSLH